MFIGLSDFKAVNETLGHQMGDVILREIADRLIRLIPGYGMLSRHGGDIFVAGLPNFSGEDTERLLSEISVTLNRPFNLGGFSIDVSAIVGAAAADSSEESAESLMSRAETALYYAKRQQIPTTFFSAEMQRYTVSRLGIGAELRDAIEQNQLILYYQPKIRLKDMRSTGAEALIRWNHPTRGFVAPGLFIPTAERTVLIHPLTEWVLNEALSRAADWRERGLPISVAVNLAAANLQDKDIAKKIEGMLHDYKVSPAAVTLEITESGLMSNPARARKTAFELHELGVMLSIDDFGTGYSSLAYLKDLPVDEVKIDQIFIFGMGRNKRDAGIVHAAINLAHDLNLKVTAEGVEDEEALQKLIDFGCDAVQGYYFSKPLPAEDLETWIAARHAAPESKL